MAQSALREVSTITAGFPIAFLFFDFCYFHVYIVIKHGFDPDFDATKKHFFRRPNVKKKT